MNQCCKERAQNRQMSSQRGRRNKVKNPIQFFTPENKPWIEESPDEREALKHYGKFRLFHPLG
jgi:hypothetical protein